MDSDESDADVPSIAAEPPADVEPRLLAYLARHLDVARLTFADAPAQITHGWETFIYTFRLSGDGLSEAWQAPLILRIYPRSDSAPQAELESSVQQFVHDQGYPAPMPLAVELDQAVLDLPFMIMERVAGGPLLDIVASHPTALLRLARKMADMHVTLHRLSADGFPAPSEGTLVERRLANHTLGAEQLGEQMPADVRAGLAWLEDNKKLVIPEDVSVCHQDFHPLNLMVDENEDLSVIDWSGAALGDRHADIASTLVLLRAPPIAPPETWLERLMIRFGGPVLAWLYLRRYRQQLPVDAERLRYWEALNVFDWWQTLASFDVDPASGFLKTDIGDRIRDGQLKRMRDYFARVSKFSPSKAAPSTSTS